MKLVLHLGFHKTASSHLQQVLAATCSDRDSLRYVGPKEFRDKTVWFSLRQKGLDQKRSGNYLAELSTSADTVVISDENICGHSDDIFTHCRLYEHISSRLQSLSAFSGQFNTTEVWVAIRNPATFLPSIYCEAMRWKAYEDFRTVFKGDFQQCWLPVIRDIHDALPNCNINVFCYENYSRDILEFFTDMGLDTRLFDDSKSDIVRRSPTEHSIRIYKQVSTIVPRRLQKRILQVIERLDRNTNEKFSPFSRIEIQQLNALYTDDMARIKRELNVNFIGYSQ